MDTERAARQLQLIAETQEIADALGARAWLRGGWAMDFFLGELTRDHADIDWFAWAADASRLADALVAHGHEPVPGPPPAQQLEFAKEGMESSFALLDEDPRGRVVVAGGPWAGEPWPDGMLDAPPGRIGTVRCAIVSPGAQIEIKRMMPVWAPGRPRRAKDAEDIARLEAALRGRDARA
ncbi:nucleotidyltransferase domain-containing protein [Streptomyces sp. NBC_01565]|uniref:nucleotidyltransferase domain-containing protein n=1 Tax=unclassified Streptomyces TaxID=2593676 RepID=UPI002252E8BC|nr:aminoglycoside adenylyltransferase [Streptomyces sp. NBC_01565]MCX4539485.1 aminoglycoside adenylyltransferase [Streptomyces sp. NBC_01565]